MHPAYPQNTCFKRTLKDLHVRILIVFFFKLVKEFSLCNVTSHQHHKLQYTFSVFFFPNLVLFLTFCSPEYFNLCSYSSLSVIRALYRKPHVQDICLNFRELCSFAPLIWTVDCFVTKLQLWSICIYLKSLDLWHCTLCSITSYLRAETSVTFWFYLCIFCRQVHITALLR